MNRAPWIATALAALSLLAGCAGPPTPPAAPALVEPLPAPAEAPRLDHVEALERGLDWILEREARPAPSPAPTELASRERAQ